MLGDGGRILREGVGEVHLIRFCVGSAVEHGMHKNFMKHMHSTDNTLHVNIQYFI